MAPPPITPSPHRFIPTKPANPTPKPTSSLRFQQASTQIPSSQQFAPTPKFSFSSTQKGKNEHATPAPQFSTPLSRRPHLPIGQSQQKREDVEKETSTNRDEAGDLVDDVPTFVLPTQPTTKRRRPNPPEAEAIILSSSPSPSPSSSPSSLPLPTTEKAEPEIEHTTSVYDIPFPRPHPRFVLPDPNRNHTPSIPSRPPLILPPRSPSPQPEPSAFFSPSRRGQKYVTGGLAATVRDWIVETSQMAHNQARARKGSGEVWDFEVRIRDCGFGEEGVGMLLVRERDGGRKWMLAGRGRGDAEVEVGCLVGIREPTWEIEVEEERWRVAVEWKVLGG